MSHIVVIRPDCEWADSPTLRRVYPTSQAAIEAALADPILRPDSFGNEAHPSVIAADVRDYTCYGLAHECAACTLAIIDGRISIGA